MMKGVWAMAALAGAALALSGCNETAALEVDQANAGRSAPGDLCVAAVSEQVEVVDVTVLDVATPTADTVVTVVTVGVGTALVPWRCSVSAQGVVTEVEAVTG